MTSSVDAVQILQTPEVKTYLVNMFGQSESGEQSYERLLEFFTLHSKLETEVALRREQALDSEKAPRALVSEAAKDLGIWDPERILQETESSIRKGLERFRRSQYKDGAWGYHAGKSSAWATAHALLALNAAHQLGITSYAHEIEQGFSWMAKHLEEWSLADIPPKKSTSIYEASLAIRCFLENDRHHVAVDSSLKKIVRAQNSDGGWNTQIAGAGFVRKTEPGSEVGATSMALRALAAPSNQVEFQKALEKGLKWIFDAQQEDGFWLTSGSTEFPLKERNRPSLAKTCDALAGIAAARSAAPEQDCAPVVSKALRWVFDQEKFLPGSAGWGYEEVDPQTSAEVASQPALSPDLVSTCLALEALVATEGVTLPQIATYAQLLMAAQINKPGSPEDGMWEKGDTFRTTLALIRYWTKIKYDVALDHDVLIPKGFPLKLRRAT